MLCGEGGRGGDCDPVVSSPGAGQCIQSESEVRIVCVCVRVEREHALQMRFAASCCLGILLIRVCAVCVRVGGCCLHRTQATMHAARRRW